MAGAVVFNIKPSDGWTQVTTGSTTYFQLRSQSSNHPIFVTTAATKPAATAPGYKVDRHEHFRVNVTNANPYWVKCVDEQPQGNMILVFSI